MSEGDRLYEARLVRNMLAKRGPLRITDEAGNTVVVSLPTFDWLIDEVERLQRLQRLPLVGEVERLRGRLRELEWAAPDCPACGAPGPGTVAPGIASGHHEPDCWLWAEIRST